MNIKFLGNAENSNEEYTSFWSWHPNLRYHFEIEYDIEKNFEIYVKELRLNLKHQLGHERIWRVK